jgi:hypothetical protein
MLHSGMLYNGTELQKSMLSKNGKPKGSVFQEGIVQNGTLQNGMLQNTTTEWYAIYSMFWKVTSQIGEPLQNSLTVPDRRRRIGPEVVLVRCWVLGYWEFGGGRVWGRVGSGEVSLQAT